MIKYDSWQRRGLDNGNEFRKPFCVSWSRAQNRGSGSGRGTGIADGTASPNTRPGSTVQSHTRSSKSSVLLRTRETSANQSDLALTSEMAAHLPRTASGIASTLTSVLRPRSLVSSSRTFATSRRCLHQEPTSEAAAVVPETSETTPEVSGTAKKTYERKPERLAYKPVKKYQNVRPQPIAPYGVRVRQPYIVNDNPKMLDAMYKDLFGADEFGLENGLKWQAVTHKSFDHGRQPYNEKLALMGMVHFARGNPSSTSCMSLFRSDSMYRRTSVKVTCRLGHHFKTHNNRLRNPLGVQIRRRSCLSAARALCI